MSADQWPAWAREAYEERAAIMEHDGGLSRAEAEAAAREAIDRCANGCCSGLLQDGWTRCTDPAVDAALRLAGGTVQPRGTGLGLC